MTPLLEIRRLSVRFGGLLALDDVSLAMPAGRIHGLIGPNGAGKTTLFNSISGLVSPTSGTLHFDGVDIGGMRTPARARLGIRRTFQSVQLIQQATALENVLIGLDDQIPWRSLASILSLRGYGRHEWEAEQRAYEALRYFGIGELAFRAVNTLSFRQQRYVEVARALVSSPRMLLLDEPAAGLSPNEVDELSEVLCRVNEEKKIAILLVEHVLALVLNISEIVTVMENGCVIAEDEPAKIIDDDAVKAAYLGESMHAAAS